MGNFIQITGSTIIDQMRHRSFFILLGISIVFVLMIRTCYSGNYSVNGNPVDTVTIAWYASKIVFQVIAVGMFLMVSLLAMRIFSRDRDDGSLVLYLSRSVVRWQYVCGRVAGTWMLSLVFMFTLHLTIFLTAWAKTGGIIPGFLTASLISCVNLLFIIVCVSLFSLFMPDFISALFTWGIILIGFISDGGYQVMNTQLVKSAIPSAIPADPSLWRILYPKIFMVQSYAGSLISKTEFNPMGPLHPVLNVLLYILLILVILLLSFNRKEI